MKIKILYRKNLKMSPGKLAAQAVHAALGLYGIEHGSVVVLEASDRKFNEHQHEQNMSGNLYHVVRDAGRTELKPGTETCVATFEQDPPIVETKIEHLSTGEHVVTHIREEEDS